MAQKAPVLFGGFDGVDPDGSGLTSAYRVPRDGRYEVLGIHGFGQVLGHAVATPTDVAAVLRDRAEDPELIGASLRGALTLVLRDSSTGHRLLLADPFGGGIVFMWRDARRWCASSSLPTLVAFLSGHGVRLRKSLGYAAAVGLIGNGGLFPAPYEDVEVLPQFSYLRQVAGRFEIHRYSTRGEFFTVRRDDAAHYRHMLEAVADDVVTNIDIYSRYPAADYISHLTGGLDSRTILAGLTRTEHLDKYSLFTSGPDYTPDVMVARQVASHFDLRVTDHSGLNVSIAPSSAAQAELWAMFETGGVLPGPAHSGMTGPPDSVVLSGGYSLLRSYYGAEFDSHAPRADRERWLVDAMLGMASPYRKNFDGGLFAASVVERVHAMAQDILNEVDDLELPADTLPDHAFFRLRSRYYTGEIQRSLSSFVHRGDALYSKNLLSLAYSAPRAQRIDNFVQLDLIRQLNEELMLLPYDAPRITESYRRARPSLPPETLPVQRATRRRHTLRLQGAHPMGTKSPRPTAAQEAEAQRISAPVRLVLGAEASQQGLRQAIDSLGEDALKATFNVPQLRRLAEVKPRSRPLYRSLNTLNTTVTWFLESCLRRWIQADSPAVHYPGWSSAHHIDPWTLLRPPARLMPFRGGTMHLPLEPLLQVAHPQGKTLTHDPSDDLADSVFIPRAHFQHDLVSRRQFEPAMVDGVAHLRISTRYARPAALGAWVLRLSINGMPLQRWRGALTAGRIRIRVDGVRKGDVLALEIRSLQDRTGAVSWEKATRYRIEESRFEPHSMAAGSRPLAHADVTDPRLDPGTVAADSVAVPIEALHSGQDVLPDLEWDIPQRWAVSTDHFVLPLLLVPRTNAAGSIVLCNGAVDLERSRGLPVFQRSSWHARIPQHQVYVCDPGTVGSEALSLSWGHLSGGIWCVPQAAQAVQGILGLLEGQRPLRRTYFGSSAGGFWALGLMHHDPGAAAVVNNAQFDWTRWMAGGVNALRKARFNGSLPATIRSGYPTQTSALRLLTSGDQPRAVDYYVNLASQHDRTVDLEQARRFQIEEPHLSSAFRIHGYEDPETGHNPMSQDATLSAIQASQVRLGSAE